MTATYVILAIVAFIITAIGIAPRERRQRGRKPVDRQTTENVVRLSERAERKRSGRLSA